GKAHTNIDTVVSPVPSPEGVTVSSLDYLPLSFRYDANMHDGWGTTSVGLGLAFNMWHSGSISNLYKLTGSSQSTGYWIIFTPSITRDFVFHTNWTLSLHADGQVASQPLISNEQYGAGGVNSVRGYHEGEVFGDDGWRVTIEQKTPACVIGMVTRN